MRKETEFKKIFEDHWDRFKQKYPAYNDVFYDQAVEKMLGCGDAKNGYTLDSAVFKIDNSNNKPIRRLFDTSARL